MNLFGNGLIFIALTATVLSAIYYYRSAVSSTQSAKNARLWLQIGAAAIVALSALLLTLLLQHDFSNGYVYSYSSRDLPLHFLLSSFYAGQEGSFLFWVLCSALIGLSLLSFTRQEKERTMGNDRVHGCAGIPDSLVYAKTPFKSVWEMIPQLPTGQFLKMGVA